MMHQNIQVIIETQMKIQGQDFLAGHLKQVRQASMETQAMEQSVQTPSMEDLMRNPKHHCQSFQAMSLYWQNMARIVRMMHQVQKNPLTLQMEHQITAHNPKNL